MNGTADSPGRVRLIWNVLRGPLAGLVDRLDDLVTGPINARARERGWSVRRVPGTRTYEYRNPTFDRRHACAACGGIGLEGVHPCPRCDGDGVVTDQPAHTTEGTS